MKKISKKILASALALAMTFACSTMVSAATPGATQSAVLNSDGTVTVTLTATGEGKYAAAGFSYGIVYDSTKVEPISYQSKEDDPDTGEEVEVTRYAHINDDFKKAMSLVEEGNKSTEGYIGIGGMAMNATAYTGVIATANFKAKDGASIEDAEFVLLPDYAEDETVVDGKPILDEIKGGNINNAKPDAVQKPQEAAAQPSEGPQDPQPTTDSKEPQPTQNATQNPQGSNAPAATAATTKKPTSPKTGDSVSVVLPIVAICGAAAAVVVASKKKVED